MKYGLVLEGGAMRGMFTAGVLDVLMENEIKFDGAVGVSAGAAFGCNYKSGQRGRAIRYNIRFCRDKRYCSYESLIKTGDMFGAEFCYKTIPDELDYFDRKEFRQNPMEFYVNATDIEAGKSVYHKCTEGNDNDLKWLRASASMPLASKIVEINGKKLLDGGISDSIPLKFMESVGYDRNIVILTQPRDYVKRKSKSASLVSLAYRKYPKLVELYRRRPEIYNRELEYIRNAEKSGRTFVISPDCKLPIGHVEHDDEVILEVYRMGRNTANRILDDLKEFMGIE